MDDQSRRAEITGRLAAAGAAHDEYESTALHGEYDQQWAEWYAEYLIAHGWNDLFARRWSIQELADALRAADAKQRAHAPQTPWQEYYAVCFAERA